MAEQPFFDMDDRAIGREVARLDKSLDLAGRDFERGAELALVQYAEDTLSEAQMRAPHKTGLLRGSASVDVEKRDGQTTVWMSFNTPYSHIQDEGGEIRPVRADALFIPLRDGVVPGDPNLEFGTDFVLAKKVTIKGNQYLTGLIPERSRAMPKAVGRRAFQIMTRSRRR